MNMPNDQHATACNLIQVSLCVLSVLLAAPAGAADEIVRPDERVTASLDNWRTSDPPGADASWMLLADPQRGDVLRTTGKSAYRPPRRSPRNYAILNDVLVSDFELTVDLQNTRPDAGNHRDLCLFFGYQDPSHFYYVHFGAVADPHSCQIFIVNDAPRTKITTNETVGTKWTDGWHQARVVRDTNRGEIAVFFDDMENPAMVANDKTFMWGEVGVGTFDDHGNFTNLRLTGVRRDGSD